MSRSTCVRGGAMSITAMMASWLIACGGSMPTNSEAAPSPVGADVPAATSPESGSGATPGTESGSGATPGTEIGSGATPGTEIGSGATSGSIGSEPSQEAASTAGARWSPKPGTSWQIQFSGTLNTNVNAQAFDLDLFDTPQSVIQALKAQGKKVICYFSAGSYENWRPDAKQFPAQVLGAALSGWPGERWLDIRAPQLIELMKRRMDLAVQKKCDAVDLDNMDGYTNPTGLPLTAQHQLNYNRTLAAEAHARGLSIGLKNDLNQIRDLVDHFDFEINEQCFFYNECQLLQPFIQAGKAVFSIEYTGRVSDVCKKANAMNFDTLIKNLQLDAARTACR